MRSDAKTDAHHDLAVIGAGVIGLSCAWRAAQAGMSVVVLERDEPGAGASGVAAGMLAPVTEAEFGEEALLRANVEARGLWPGFAAELSELTGISTGYAESGALVVAADRDDAEELRRVHDYHHRLGLRSEWLGPREARSLEPGLSPRIGGAIDAPEEGHVDPGAAVRALEAALESAGGVVVTGAEVRALDTARGRVCGVCLAGGESGARRARAGRRGRLERGGRAGRRGRSPRGAPREGPAPGAAHPPRRGRRRPPA